MARWWLTVQRYFHVDKNSSSEQIYALLDYLESANEDDIDNLINDSDTEFIAEEEITQAASTQDSSLTTPEANLHAAPRENQSKKKKYLWKWTKKVKVTKKKECHLMPEIQPSLNVNSFPNKNIFFGDQPRRAARIVSWTIKPLWSSEWKKLHSYQERAESISWNKLCYGNQ